MLRLHIVFAALGVCYKFTGQPTTSVVDSQVLVRRFLEGCGEQEIVLKVEG